MKKAFSFVLAIAMMASLLLCQCSVAYSTTKVYAEDKLKTIQTQTGYIPGKTSVVTGNCYAFIAKVCEKLYGDTYNGEGLYGNYNASHSSGNYYTVSTYTTTNTSPTSSDVQAIINFFVNNAQSGDVVHYGAYTTGTSNTSTHTFMIQNVDSTKMQIYHANYATGNYESTDCHIDTIYWNSFKSSPTKSVYNSDGSCYSLNALFYNKMKTSGLGISINRYKNYSSMFYMTDSTGSVIEAVTPEKVTDLTVTSKAATSLGIKWSDVDDADSYYVYVKNNTKDTSFSKTVTSTSTTLNNLTASNSYTIKVRGVSATGDYGAYSSAVTVTTPSATAKVTGLESTATTTTSISIKWKKATNATKYYIYITNNTKSTTFNKTVTTNTATLNNLTAGNSYTIKVKAYTSAGGWGSYSAAITLPAKPNKVTVGSLTSPSTKNLNLTWTKVTGSASGYQIYYSTTKDFSSNVTKKYVSGMSNVSYKLSGFTKGKTYYVKIRAYKTVNSTKYYGAFSSVKSVKCK